MDIMFPPLDQQPSPAPQLVVRQRVDGEAVVRQALAQHPDATPDEIADILRGWGYQFSGLWLARTVTNLRRTSDPPSTAGV